MTAVGCQAILQGIFPTRGLNPRLIMLPTLASCFFTTSITWEVQEVRVWWVKCICKNLSMFFWTLVQTIHTHKQPGWEGVQCSWKEFSEPRVQRGENSPKEIILSVLLASADAVADVGVSVQAPQHVRGLALGGSLRIYQALSAPPADSVAPEAVLALSSQKHETLWLEFFISSPQPVPAAAQSPGIINRMCRNEDACWFKNLQSRPPS